MIPAGKQMKILMLLPFGLSPERNRAIFQRTLYLGSLKIATLFLRTAKNLPVEHKENCTVIWSKSPNYFFYVIEALIRLTSGKYDTVYTYQTVDWMVGLFARVVLAKKWFLESQHSPYYYADVAGSNPFKKMVGAFNILMAKVGYRAADRHIVMSHGTARGLAKLLAGDFGVPAANMLAVPNGVSIRLCEEHVIGHKRDYFSKARNIITYVGTLSAGRGAELARIAEVLGNSDTEFIAAGPARSDMDVEGLQKTKWVKYLGAISHEMALDLVSQSDICLFIGNSKFRDNKIAHPGKLLEYMVFKRPIVAPAYGEICGFLKHGETALLYEPENFEDCVSKVRELLDSRELCLELGENAARRVKEFEWDSINSIVAGYVCN